MLGSTAHLGEVHVGPGDILQEPKWFPDIHVNFIYLLWEFRCIAGESSWRNALFKAGPELEGVLLESFWASGKVFDYITTLLFWTLRNVMFCGFQK